MARPFDDEMEDLSPELDGAPEPTDTLAGAQTPRDAVMERIRAVKNPALEQDPSRDAAMQFAKSSALTSGLGRALNTLASGTGFKADDSAYDAIDKQPAIAFQDLSRQDAIKKAIADRQMRAQMMKERSDALAATQKERQIDNARADRALNLKARELDLMRGEREQKNIEKKEEKDRMLAVPGYQLTGEVQPKVEEAQKFREAVGETSNLLNSLRRYRELAKKNGSFEYFGPEAQEMKSLVRDIQLQSKGPAMYQLGVLAGPDMQLLEDITADPSSLKSLFTSNPTRMAQIDTQLQQLENRIASKSKALGYQSSPQAAPPPSGGLPPDKEARRQALLKKKMEGVHAVNR